MKITEKCDRCGYTKHLERHHIKYRIEGGDNARTNLVILCKNCHDYRHAKEQIEKAILSYEKRLAILRKRLELVEELNTPMKILECGYQSYFEIFKEPLNPIRGCKQL